MALGTRIRTINFLPDIFQTPTNKQFLGATLDQIVNPPNTKRIEGYIGSRFGYGINANDYYVTEPNKTRRDYQLDPGIVFTKPNEETTKDFLSYPGLIDSLKLNNGITNNNNRLFNSQFYSWDSFTDLDKLINFNQYYWLPDGAPSVTVAADTVFATNDYIVIDQVNGYNIKVLGASAGTINPTITLIRGGAYNFIVNQNSPFWIQGKPGVTGYDPEQPNVQTREVYGVTNNGVTSGIVTFNVPFKNSQEQYDFPGNNSVGIISTQPFNDLQGKLLSEIGNIDGITSLENLTVMFYNTGLPNELGYVWSYYDEVSYDTTNSNLVSPVSITIGSTAGTDLVLASGDTSGLTVGNTITFNNPTLGGLTPGQVYYIHSIVNSTSFRVSTTVGTGSVPISLISSAGTMTGVINDGLYEGGFYTNVDENFYKIVYVGDPSNPTIRLEPVGLIPNEQKITAQSGTEFSGRHFYRTPTGIISLIPYISATLDTLYYQDGTSPNKVGVIRLIDSNVSNTLNVETEILGKKNFTSRNGVVFTNGLKVSFDGDVVPSSYLNGEYYVQGVGTAIELINVADLICPESFTSGNYVGFDTTSYDIGNFDGDLFVPVDPDYLTIARNSISKNPWSRSNRWFHIDVINATAAYNNNPQIAIDFAPATAKAKRPIIEFYPNIKLFNSGSAGKKPIDFIDFRTTDAFEEVVGQESYYPDVEVYTTASAIIAPVTGTSTTITILASNVTGKFQVGQYVADSTNQLPNNAYISSISGTTTLTLTIEWNGTATLAGTSVASIVAADTTIENFGLFTGSRIVFANDEAIKDKIYLVNFEVLTPGSNPVITLTEDDDGQVLYDNQVVVLRGYNYQGDSFYYNGIEWNQAQAKITVNQAPLFDVFDKSGVSFGDQTVYVGTSFAGCKLFNYGLGEGPDDSILGFPLRYSSVSNVGDISFDVSLNSDTFNYVSNYNPITEPVNSGYVHDYYTRIDYTRGIGWQTAVSPSVQYQVFQFNFDITNDTPTFVCDVAAFTTTEWPEIFVYINNDLLPTDEFTSTVSANSTTITLTNTPIASTIVQVLVLSKQVSQSAYYQIPINLNNNPLNQDITTANIGDIRGQYQSMFINAPNTTGPVFGSNNFRDLGNLVPYGNRIIQNSASLVLPGAFLRDQSNNLMNALLFNSREYIKFKTILADTITKSNYNQLFDPAYVLDDALDQITMTKTQEQAFFWSDMIPSKSAYVTNTYTFKNSADVTIYPLLKIYDFNQANYDGVLVYRNTVINGTIVSEQLIKGVDYTISENSPSITVTKDLNSGDRIVIKEYNQTYGSYIPNTPTKLGLYPSYIPRVVLDPNFLTPTYFILGHDGSYTRLYGDYNPVTGVLIDFRDQALLEFEKRVFNNLKLPNQLPLPYTDVIPSNFRTTDYSYDEILEIYSYNFLNWVGENRLEYKQQFYSPYDKYTFNYKNSQNKLNSKPLKQGNWRGLYSYFYDTTTPNTTPWEMLGYTSKPSYWEERYGPAPYTSDNLVLWGDMSAGLDYSTGEGVVKPQYVRPGLLDVIPVDGSGNLLPPLDVMVGNYNSISFRKNWEIGDNGPVELSYRRSSSWPFDLMKILALCEPAKFYNLGVDLDNYRYNTEFNQYLVNDRKHLIIDEISIYGSGTAKTSYINWVVDYQKQVGINSTENIKTLLKNLDVRLVYRAAGFTDKNLLKFYVEKGTPNSRNASLLIPDESFSVLLYENQPFDKLTFSSIIIQLVSGKFAVYGNSQTSAYFTTLSPNYGTLKQDIRVEEQTVQIYDQYLPTEQIIPYGTLYNSVEEVAQFISNYNGWLESKGFKFEEVENGVPVTWQQMIAEFLYWTQLGWESGSVITINPSAKKLKVDREGSVIQPLVLQQQNFILNQNLYPIQLTDLNVVREENVFEVKPLNEGDTVAFGQFYVSNIEHGIVFDNVTLFNDIIYNLITGLRQIRILCRGTKTAEWNGTVNAYGFILNQDNITEWRKDGKYTKGAIVKYKNKYWTALKIVQPQQKFNELEWKETEYDEIQKGLLPNASTRSYESTLYYDINKANLEQDADLLSFSLIGFRPRDYLALADLTDITQVNVYKNLISQKGTKNSVSAFKGANFPEGGIDYEVYENWAIKSATYGGVENDNFVEFRLNESTLTGNPSIVGLTNGVYEDGVQQEVPTYSLFNYSKPISDPNILTTLSPLQQPMLLPDAGYVNYNDVKLASYFYSGLPTARDKNGNVVPITDFNVGDYAWLANYLEKWQVMSAYSIGRVTTVTVNINNTCTVRFDQPHNLTQYQIFSIINFNISVNGYYLASQILDPYRVVINLILPAGIKEITGQGIGLAFNSNRVSTPGDIINLPLLNSEFSQNKVWVDTDVTGSWAVYNKKLNYTYLQEITKANSSEFGSAVAISPTLGYLISDASLGEAYRYTYNDLTQTYNLVQTIPGADVPITTNPSFGKVIVHSDDIFVISEPTSVSPKIYILVLNQTIVKNDLIPYQAAISAPVGFTEYGTSLALSEDGNWLYVTGKDASNSKVHVYRRQNFNLNSGYFVPGQTYRITNVGNTDFTLLGAMANEEGIVFVATGAGTVGQTGVATQCTFEYIAEIDDEITLGDGFGYSLATDFSGSTLFVGTPFVDYDAVTESNGQATAYQRNIQNFEIQYNSVPNQPQLLELVWTPNTTTKTLASTTAPNTLTLNSVSGLAVNDPIIFTGSGLANTGVSGEKVYYIASLPGGNNITIKESRSTTTPSIVTTKGSVSASATAQTTPFYVSVNGRLVSDANYAVIGSILYYVGNLSAGDIVEFSDSQFVRIQSLDSNSTPKVGKQYGYALDCTIQADEVLVGAPFELTGQRLQEGAAYRFTNSGCKFGKVTSTGDVNVTTARNLLINGYRVVIPAGNATTAASAINNSNITNVQAAANNNRLTISIISSQLSVPHKKLNITAPSVTTLTELGLELYSLTQTVLCPHEEGPTQFGSAINFNEFDSVAISAPVGTRYTQTTFDFVDDSDYTNDTIFDNNSTQFIDTFANTGAVYMFDYLDNYQEDLDNLGSFVYAQSINARNLVNGLQPRYGQTLDFNSNKVIISAPNFDAFENRGQVVIYENNVGTPDWSVSRFSAPIVDVSKIQNAQLFSAETNKTLVNLDYFDPLQGKLLGVVRQNIDVISNLDPADYNNGFQEQRRLVWGSTKVGTIWLDTTNIRWVNYHQNDDIVYNSQYWGQVFPGSDVAVYSWVASNVPPAEYQGLGTPYDVNLFSVQTTLNASNIVTPVYYFWVRNSNIIFHKRGKTLADSIIEQYIQDPKLSGVSYFAPLLPNAFGLYNSGEYINANDTVFHIGYNLNVSNDIVHNEFTLIRANYADDFLPGLPGLYNQTRIDRPQYLYDRMLDSLSGVDEVGAVVPNPYLPKAVQSGVLARPRQSFFYNRFKALENYLSYANEILRQYPITELVPSLYFLFETGEFYNTPDYWEYVNWWAVGYNNNTKAAVQVPLYADLSKLQVPVGTIVAVGANNDGKSETYRLDPNNLWTRIGLQNGTIQFKSELWDYESARIGFGDNFFDTSPFDSYPSEETRYITRALNEQIYIENLLVHRNKSLILLFEYIQAESIENQNYLPWLNKTSLLDVNHKVRELLPYEVYRGNNQEFLAGYINEVKPYHVVIKDFLFTYSGETVYDGDITDFDLPATYNTNIEKFETPQLVYKNPQQGQYLPSSDIWERPEYSQWFKNFGLTIQGQADFQITTLSSYLTSNTSFIMVDNASGFPINGTIRIGEELIGYSFVDRALNILYGLSRGIDSTAIVNHIPGEKIYINLPPVLLLNSGRGYSEPPRVIAYVDPNLTKTAEFTGTITDNILTIGSIISGQVIVGNYLEGTSVTPFTQILSENADGTYNVSQTPNVSTTFVQYVGPKVPAQLEAVMNLDSVLSINVINPGQGYLSLPEIRIDPALVVNFESVAVNPTLNTVQLYAPYLQTGDLVQYHQGTGAPIGGLDDGQWYYINLLTATPIAVIALYTTFRDAVNDDNRVEIYNSGNGVDYALSLGAKASAITNASPVRENNITLRFDRTTYNSEVLDWRSGAFYGAFFAGNYYNSEKVSSSAIKLESTQPPISTILASAQGVAFEITDVTNDQEVIWSSFIRTVSQTVAANDVIRLVPYDNGANEPNASGSTIGFTVGMPVKFTGTPIGGLQLNTIYYVESIVNNTDFKVSATVGGPAISLTSQTSMAELFCHTAQVVDTAILTLNYPGIETVTESDTINNSLTAPLSEIGTGGTLGFYVGLPVFFTGNVFGGIVENDVYYITTVIDDERFTISEQENPLTYDVTQTFTGTNLIQLDSVVGLSINDPIIFNTMVVDQVPTNIFGGIVSGTVYYVASVNVLNNRISIATEINGATFALSNETGTALCTSQKNVVQLSTATGEMTMNVSLPVSPGQINGQKFTIYETSRQYPNITNLPIGTVITPTINATVAGGNVVAISSLSGGTTNMYKNMPIEFDTDMGSISAGSTYYVESTGVITVDVTSTESQVAAIMTGSISGTTLTVTAVASGSLVKGALLVGTGISVGTRIVTQIAGTAGGVGTYEVNKTQTVGSTSINASIGRLTAVTTEQLYVGMPIVFTGFGLGGVTIGDEYFVRSIENDGIHFTISDVGNPLGGALPLTNSNGIMTGTGDPYIKLASNINGSEVDPGNSIQAATISVASPAVITVAQAPNNGTRVTFASTGFLPAGISPGASYYVRNSSGTTFNISVTPAGSLLNTSGTQSGSHVVIQKPITGTQSPIEIPIFNVSYILGGYRVTVTEAGMGFAVDNTFTIPGTLVGGVTPDNDINVAVNTIANIDTTITNTTTGTNRITVSTTLGLSVNDPIVFTGTTFGNIVANTVYYILSIPSATELVISSTIGGAAFALITASGSCQASVVGKITDFIVSGVVPGTSEEYYLKVINETQAAVYSNPLMTVPVSGLDFPFVGFTSTAVTGINSGADQITVTDASEFVLNDAVIFSGDTEYNVTNIVAGNTYYIYSISGNNIVLTSIPGDATGIINIITTKSVGFTMAKAGSFALLPEPFYFNQSVVKFNGKVYICVISNNDSEFVFGKWELLDSGDRRLNALDRVIGYYNPTDNMPGVDLTQLFTGVIYPNSTYRGNAFEPAQQYTLDTILQNQPFYPTNVNITSILWDGNNYRAAANIPTTTLIPNYSAVITTPDPNTSWDILKLANTDLQFTDILYGGGFYVMTSRNMSTPIYRSNDGINWTTNGYFTPFGSAPFDDTPFDVTNLNISGVSLNAVTYGNGKYIAVGGKLISSPDTYLWNELVQFNPEYNVELYGITYANIPSFTGYVTVGKGLRPDYSTGLTALLPTDIIIISPDGTNWTQLGSYTPSGLYGVAANGSLIVAVGENGVIYRSNNGGNWVSSDETQILSMNLGLNNLTVTNTVGFNLNDRVRFNYAFGNIQALTDAGDFVIGATYTIESVGTTDFTLIGATSNTVGVTFVATGVGTGTGTAYADYYVSNIVSATQIEVSETFGGSSITLTGANPVIQTIMYKYPFDITLRDILYANGVFIAVGDSGIIRTSTNGITWTTQPSYVTNDLNGVIYNPSNSTFVVVGDNNVILESVDNGVTWTSANLFTVTPTVYDVQGGEFLDGYGPEELVPGVVKDELIMTVVTRPGTNWPVVEYAAVGYLVRSIVLTPLIESQLTFSFDGIVDVPQQVGVFQINRDTNLSTGLYQGVDYTVDWINNTITLLDTTNPLNFVTTGYTDKIRIDIYETGNGDQLVKSSTKSDAIRNNSVTGWQEIYVNCNYSATRFAGGGVVRPGTQPINVICTATDGTNYTITVEDVTDFVANDPIRFQGAVFGGLQEDIDYFVKTIDPASNTITVSTSLVAGIAGPTFFVTTGTGTMTAVLQVGSGQYWTDPLMYHNGIKLIHGTTGNVTRTKASNNAITANTTNGLYVGEKIEFSNTMFGGVLIPHTHYYIASIVDTNEFTVSNIANPISASSMIAGQRYAIVTVGTTNFVSYGATFNTVGQVFVATGSGIGTGTVYPVVTLTNATGGASFITNDYALGIQPNGISAKIILSDQYNNAADYLTYTLFGETQPEQFSYTIPETQLFTGNGAAAQYSLSNFVGGVNDDNAIVEINGVRQTQSAYIINGVLNTITFTSPPAANSVIAVTSFGSTQRQYLNTQFGITGVPGATYSTYVVGSTHHSEVAYDGIFTAGTFTIGQAYIIESVGTTDFTLIGAASNTVGLTFVATGAGSGTGTASVGYDVNTATSVNAGLFVNGTEYIITSVGTTDFTLIGAASNTVGLSFVATGAGSGTGTAVVVAGGSYDENFNWLRLTTGTTATMTVGDTIVFSSPTIGGVLDDQVYYIIEILNSTDFVISSTAGGTPFDLNIETAGDFTIGQTYIINSIGNTDFTLIGAASNTVGLSFTATGVGSGTGTAYRPVITGSMVSAANGLTVADITAISNIISPPDAITIATNSYATDDTILVSSTSGFITGQPVIFRAAVLPAGSFVPGSTYQITSVGTTDFTAIGAASNTVGITFVASGAGTGTGTALLADFGGVNTLGEYYFVGDVNPTINAGSFVTGLDYTISTIGTTDFTLIGAASNTPGIIFTATGPGAGTGTATANNQFTIKDEDGNTVTLSTFTSTVQVVAGGQPAIRVFTGIDHNLSENTLIRIDGTEGSVELNNQTFYAKIVTSKIIDLYSEPYSPEIGALNYPVESCSNYLGGGYVWQNGLFTVSTTVGTGTDSGNNTIIVNNAISLIPGTPVILTQFNVELGDATLGGLLAGEVYYVREVFSSTRFTVSAERYGDELTLTSSTGFISVSQWEQTNVDRLWVTINGYRVPSNRLRLNPANNLSILAVIEPGDEVIITSMVPTATPDEQVYINLVDQLGNAQIYRANTRTRTWLTQTLYDTQDIIYVDDVTRITDQRIQTSTVGVPVDGVYTVGLNANKDTITQIQVYNVTKATTISSTNINLVIEMMAPVLRIDAGSYISTGDTLAITIFEGNTIIIDGEQIIFDQVDFANNTLTGLTRGANGTGKHVIVPQYSEVYSLLENNLLPSADYSKTWNSDNLNPVDGDPLQLSTTTPALFLKRDIT